MAVGDLLLVGLGGIISGAVAVLTGFGIGSLLTPIFVLFADARIAVAAVAIPHLVGTALRLALLRSHVDHRLLLRFGITSAAGGVLGALLHGRMPVRALSVVFAALLLLAAAAELTRWMTRVRWGRRSAWIAGLLSGFLGGLVGNQGSIRSAAMLGFDVPRHAFVATASAVALFVDGARLPVYLVSYGPRIAALWPLVLAGSAGVLLGTIAGQRVLSRLPEARFRQVVAVVLILLAGFMLASSQ